MQFGRVCGMGLIILGITLCLFQFVRYAGQPKTDVNPSLTEEKSVHIVSSLTGIVGAGSLAAGIALFIAARAKNEPDPKYKVK